MMLPGTLHACFVRSPHAHARIKSIDAAAARAMPGVHAVLTADDLPPRMATGQIPMLVPNPSIKTPRTQLALARHEVCYVGQTIAVVIADDRYLAEDAAAAVKVDFDVLPAVSDCPRGRQARCAARAQRSCQQRRRLRADELWRPRRGFRRRGARVRGGDLSPSRRRHDARGPRRARQLRRGRRRADGVVGDPDPAPLPRHARRSVRARSRIHPRDRAVRRRRLRHQGAVLRRGGGDPGRRHEASAAR